MREHNNPAPPAWKFWWPLSIWKVLLIFLGTSIVGNLAWVGVSMAWGWEFNAGPGGGIGGGAGALIVILLAKKRREGLSKEK